MHASKLTSKYQATIPSPIRQALHLSQGDAVIFELKAIDGKQAVIVKKAMPVDLEYADLIAHTLSEWNSPNDDEAYCDL